MKKGNLMCQPEHDITYSDLNPRFLFSCIQDRTEETQYHSHDFIELVIILKGKGHFCINGNIYNVEEGNLILLNPGTYHKSSPIVGEHGQILHATECYLGFSDVDYVNCVQNQLPLFKDYQIITKLPESFKKQLFSLCSLIHTESSSKEPGQYFMLKSYLIQILCLIERYRRQECAEECLKKDAVRYEFKSVNKKYIVQQIMDYMSKHYQEKISLDQIAANMYLSTYYISKIFKSETGDTPINYLISLRMQKARELLDAGPDCSIQSVATAVGYEDAYHFSKLFKKYYGLSPLYYKARIAPGKM